MTLTLDVKDLNLHSDSEHRVYRRALEIRESVLARNGNSRHGHLEKFTVTTSVDPFRLQVEEVCFDRGQGTLTYKRAEVLRLT